MKTLHLGTGDIDRAIAALRRAEGEWIGRGRTGDGLGHKNGVLYAIYVEDGDQENRPFADEEELRRFLAAIDLASFGSRYWVSVLEQLGVWASFDVNDAEARTEVLAEQQRLPMTGPFRWRGVVGEIVRQAGLTMVELGPQVHAAIADEAERALAAEGLRIDATWPGRTLEVKAFLEADVPSPGSVALRVHARSQLRLA